MLVLRQGRRNDGAATGYARVQCHMRHNHHGGAFFGLLDRVMPNWEKTKAQARMSTGIGRLRVGRQVEAQAPQPHRHIHGDAHYQWWRTSSAGQRRCLEWAVGGSQSFGRPLKSK
jgi:hypothetical protein